jgi:hypothetical protein
MRWNNTGRKRNIVKRRNSEKRRNHMRKIYSLRYGYGTIERIRSTGSRGNIGRRKYCTLKGGGTQREGTHSEGVNEGKRNTVTLLQTCQVGDW